MHNDGRRITYVRRGMCSYTFELPDETETIEPSANLLYFIEDDGIQGAFQYKNGQKELYITTGVSVK